MEESDISRTAMALHSLQIYGPPGRKAELDSRIERAKAWLLAAKAKNNEERNLQLLGLKWAKADEAIVRNLSKVCWPGSAPTADGGRTRTAERRLRHRTISICAPCGRVAVAGWRIWPGRALLAIDAARGWVMACEQPRAQVSAYSKADSRTITTSGFLGRNRLGDDGTGRRAG